MAGIYIHIPFCRQACHYCNFHFSTNLALQNDFTAALLKEISLQAGYLDQEVVETIYFGGGTPSILPDFAICEILNSVYRHFHIGQVPEITLEANPDDMLADRLKAWKEIGISRLSIGVQSFFNDDLSWMNRAHNANQACRAVEDGIKTGFANFNLDLIYGLPGLSDEQWLINLQTAVALGTPHISCYALTVEPRTTLNTMIRLGKTAGIESEKQATQFLAGIRFLEASGYEQYEISNFAKPGYRSRHNSSYWQSKKYLGLGPSAHSFNGQQRQWNISNNAVYIKSLKKGQLCFEQETLQPRDLLNEYIMTSLRTKEGLDLKHVADHFGKDKERLLEKNASVYFDSKQMARIDEKLILTDNGKLFADGIAAALFF